MTLVPFQVLSPVSGIKANTLLALFVNQHHLNGAAANRLLAAF